MAKNSLATQETGFNPWVRKDPLEKEWQPTPVFLPGESHGWRGLVGCSLWGCKQSDMTKQLTHTYTHVPTAIFLVVWG